MEEEIFVFVKEDNVCVVVFGFYLLVEKNVLMRGGFFFDVLFFVNLKRVYFVCVVL